MVPTMVDSERLPGCRDWELVCLHMSDTRQWQLHSSRTQRGITFHL